jgi:hypothetical protein
VIEALRTRRIICAVRKRPQHTAKYTQRQVWGLAIHPCAACHPGVPSAVARALKQ